MERIKGSDSEAKREKKKRKHNPTFPLQNKQEHSNAMDAYCFLLFVLGFTLYGLVSGCGFLTSHSQSLPHPSPTTPLNYMVTSLFSLNFIIAIYTFQVSNFSLIAVMIQLLISRIHTCILSATMI